VLVVVLVVGTLVVVLGTLVVVVAFVVVLGTFGILGTLSIIVVEGTFVAVVGVSVLVVVLVVGTLVVVVLGTFVVVLGTFVPTFVVVPVEEPWVAPAAIAFIANISSSEISRFGRGAGISEAGIDGGGGEARGELWGESMGEL